MSALGGKADIIQGKADIKKCPPMTQSGHSCLNRHSPSSTINSGLNHGVVGTIFMAEARAERRLAAILAADVAGYSRLMGVAEEGTLTALKAYRLEVIDPKIAEHRGRIVKTTAMMRLSNLQALSMQCAEPWKFSAP